MRKIKYSQKVSQHANFGQQRLVAQKACMYKRILELIGKKEDQSQCSTKRKFNKMQYNEQEE